MSAKLLQGHYRAIQWDNDQKVYVTNEEIGMNIEVHVRGGSLVELASS
jgi:hypothetical protein